MSKRVTPDSWMEDSDAEEESSTKKQKATPTRKRGRSQVFVIKEGDDVEEVVKKMQRIMLSAQEEEEMDMDETELQQELRLLKNCLSTFEPLRAGPEMKNRHGIMTAPLLKNFLQNAYRKLGVKRTSGNYIVANCHNLKKLRNDFPDATFFQPL